MSDKNKYGKNRFTSKEKRDKEKNDEVTLSELALKKMQDNNTDRLTNKMVEEIIIEYRERKR